MRTLLSPDVSDPSDTFAGAGVVAWGLLVGILVGVLYSLFRVVTMGSFLMSGTKNVLREKVLNQRVTRFRASTRSKLSVGFVRNATCQLKRILFGSNESTESQLHNDQASYSDPVSST